MAHGVDKWAVRVRVQEFFKAVNEDWSYDVEEIRVISNGAGNVRVFEVALRYIWDRLGAFCISCRWCMSNVMLSECKSHMLGAPPTVREILSMGSFIESLWCNGIVGAPLCSLGRHDRIDSWRNCTLF